jgi:ParB-like chromosome segregation protein Spo0J
MKYEVHPLAKIFPDIEGPAFDALVKDIEERGLQEPIVLFENQILDGKNRARACEQLGKDAHIRTFTGTDPVGFVLSVNLHRRHLDTSQRAMVAASLAKLEVGTNRYSKKDGPSIEVAAQLLKVGRASVERAKIVLGSGDADLIKSVQAGELAVSEAAAQVQEEQQQEGTKKSRKKKLRKPKPGTKPKTMVEYITPHDAPSAANACRVLSDHLLEALDDLQALSSVGHATEYAERTIEVLQEKIGQMQPEEEKEETAEMADAAE